MAAFFGYHSRGAKVLNDMVWGFFLPYPEIVVVPQHSLP